MTNSPPRRQRKRNYSEIVLASVFFLAYLWLAKQMETLNFDTIFIALFCTFLSSFVVRCARTVLTGR